MLYLVMYAYKTTFALRYGLLNAPTPCEFETAIMKKGFLLNLSTKREKKWARKLAKPPSQNKSTEFFFKNFKGDTRQINFHFFFLSYSEPRWKKKGESKRVPFDCEIAKFLLLFQLGIGELHWSRGEWPSSCYVSTTICVSFERKRWVSELHWKCKRPKKRRWNWINIMEATAGSGRSAKALLTL